MQKAKWRRISAALVVAGLLSASCASAATPTTDPLPRLILDESVDADFAALAQTTWEQFLTVFRTRAGCFGNVRLHAAYELESRAAYNPTTATVTVRVPGTQAMLQGALVHEWAHHIEFQCPAQKEMRPAFLAAQGLSPATLWRPEETPAEVPEGEWATIPSEQYAEATIEVVLGERQIPTTAPVSVAGVRVIAQWAAGHE